MRAVPKPHCTPPVICWRTSSGLTALPTSHTWVILVTSTTPVLCIDLDLHHAAAKGDGANGGHRAGHRVMGVEFGRLPGPCAYQQGWIVAAAKHRRAANLTQRHRRSLRGAFDEYLALGILQVIRVRFQQFGSVLA